MTLERMLLFMETGDYAIQSNPKDVAKNTLLVNSKAAYPHRGNMAMEMATAKSTAGISGPDLLLMHVNTYRIALCYEVPDLQALALEAFRNSDAVMTMEEFLDVGKFAYHNSVPGNPLRQELVFNLVNKHPEWLMERQFRQVTSHFLYRSHPLGL